MGGFLPLEEGMARLRPASVSSAAPPGRGYWPASAEPTADPPKDQDIIEYDLFKSINVLTDLQETLH